MFITHINSHVHYTIIRWDALLTLCSLVYVNLCTEERKLIGVLFSEVHK